MENIREFSALLGIKECDLRENLFIQCQYSVDKGIHIGGAQSAIAPLTALYYGGTFRCSVENPTTEEQDIFLLSKGHAVAALASVYADMGYFPKEKLKDSRGWNALIKGHPGPVIPGVPVATGPLGQGISVANGYALRQKENSGYDVYCMVGDGELQEGSCWEGIMFAAENQLDNLCVIVDKNNGQSDDTHKLFLSMDELSERLTAFGFRVLNADSGNMAGILTCLEEFKRFPRNSRPTAIICDSFKGFGGYTVNTGKHKASFNDEEVKAELDLLAHTREVRVHGLNQLDRTVIQSYAKKLGYMVNIDSKGYITGLEAIEAPVKVKRAAVRDKVLRYDPKRLPKLELGKSYGATDVAIAFSKVFAASPNFYTIDADLSNASGLYTGTGLTNRYHAINTGIAECNMMCMAEGLAACGANVWTSTFAPFFNWQAFRRIAVSYQERCEAIEAEDGWLSEGHNLDITFLATASNLDTGVNGATHMGNDDICFFSQLAHVKVIDICCPQQYLSVAKWIAQGNRGLVYLRVMRNPSKALYDSDYEFTFGKGYFLRKAEAAKAVVISSGHGVTEALAAAELLHSEGIEVSIVDMPSYDGDLLKELAAGGSVLLFAEQNNGALFDRFSHDLLSHKFMCDTKKVMHLNTRDKEDRLQFIQSGTYDQLISELGLTAQDIARTVRNSV